METTVCICNNIGTLRYPDFGIQVQVKGTMFFYNIFPYLCSSRKYSYLPMEGLRNAEVEGGLIVPDERGVSWTPKFSRGFSEQKISVINHDLCFTQFPPIVGFREWSLRSYSHLFFILFTVLALVMVIRSHNRCLIWCDAIDDTLRPNIFLLMEWNL